MATVRFAEICDKCGKQSPEYSRWAQCLDCIEDICPDCASYGTYKDMDERGWRCTCKECASENAAETMREFDKTYTNPNLEK